MRWVGVSYPLQDQTLFWSLLVISWKVNKVIQTLEANVCKLLFEFNNCLAAGYVIDHASCNLAIHLMLHFFLTDILCSIPWIFVGPLVPPTCFWFNEGGTTPTGFWWSCKGMSGLLCSEVLSCWKKYSEELFELWQQLHGTFGSTKAYA